MFFKRKKEAAADPPAKRVATGSHAKPTNSSQKQQTDSSPQKKRQTNASRRAAADENHEVLNRQASSEHYDSASEAIDDVESIEKKIPSPKRRPSPSSKKTKPASNSTAAVAANNAKAVVAPVQNLDDDGTKARQFLLERLNSTKGDVAATIELRPSLQQACDKIISTLDTTVRLGHSNSLVVVGPRGSGKTLAVERALSTLEDRYNKQRADPLVGVIRLVGWAHADERTAFKEVATQLCSAFKPTLKAFGSLGDNIEFLKKMLAALARAHKVAIFVLDEFDTFARRSKQSLLYCLLDSLQSLGVQAAVVGITTRHDCLDLMEKRVRSRFSQRTVDVCLPRGAVAVPAKKAGKEGQAPIEAADGAIDVLKSMLTLPDPPVTLPATAMKLSQSTGSIGEAFVEAHNTAVEEALESDVSIKALTRWCAAHPSLRDLGVLAQVVLASAYPSVNIVTTNGLDKANATTSNIKGRSGASSSRHQAKTIEKPVIPTGAVHNVTIAAACVSCCAADEAVTTSVSGLSTLELAMLVAVHRASRRNDKGAVNFEMAQHQFAIFTGGEAHVDRYSRDAAMKAFDRLLALGMLAPVDGRSEFRAGSRQYVPVYLQVSDEELRAGLQESKSNNQRIMTWFSREGGLGTTAGHML